MIPHPMFVLAARVTTNDGPLSLATLSNIGWAAQEEVKGVQGYFATHEDRTNFLVAYVACAIAQSNAHKTNNGSLENQLYHSGISPRDREIYRQSNILHWSIEAIAAYHKLTPSLVGAVLVSVSQLLSRI